MRLLKANTRRRYSSRRSITKNMACSHLDREAQGRRGTQRQHRKTRGEAVQKHQLEIERASTLKTALPMNPASKKAEKGMMRYPEAMPHRSKATLGTSTSG